MENANLQKPRAKSRGKAAPAPPPPPAEEPMPHELLEKAGLKRLGGEFFLADAFRFRHIINSAVRREEAAAQELVDALSEAWSEPDELRAALQPTRTPAAAAPALDSNIFGDMAVRDSLVRLLLQCESVQTELANNLLQMLPALQDELEGSSSGMPLPKLLLSQFRWLEHVVDGGEAVLETIGEMLQVVDPPLRRELVLILPDLVQDGQHRAAVELLQALLRDDSQFTAPVLEALSSLHLDADLETEVVDLVTQSVASSSAADLPCVVRFLLAHVSAANAPQVTSALRVGLSSVVSRSRTPTCKTASTHAAPSMALWRCRARAH